MYQYGVYVHIVYHKWGRCAVLFSKKVPQKLETGFHVYLLFNNSYLNALMKCIAVLDRPDIIEVRG